MTKSNREFLFVKFLAEPSLVKWSDYVVWSDVLDSSIDVFGEVNIPTLPEAQFTEFMCTYAWMSDLSPKWVRLATNGTRSQNVLKSDLKKSRMCLISAQSDPLLAQI